MEGDRPITLFEPNPTGEEDSYGEPIFGEPIEHLAFAIRRDRGGSEGLQADTQVGEWNTRFEVRMEGLADIKATWALRDERGRDCDIEAIAEAPIARNRWWWLYCVARS